MISTINNFNCFDEEEFIKLEKKLNKTAFNYTSGYPGRITNIDGKYSFDDGAIWKVIQGEDGKEYLVKEVENDEIIRVASTTKTITAKEIEDTSYWFDLWYEDKEGILNTMLKNMRADLDAGYDYFGKSITQQREDIDNYKKKFDEEVEMLKNKTPKETEHWCKLDLKKRGAI